jgi:DeoR family transcriptional regulator of aga operon
MKKPDQAVPERLLVEERRRRIVDRVDQDGRATVDELTRHFNVSAVTIRGDLEALARAGAITRSHGGALPAAVARTDTPLTIKETRHLAQKRRIGAAAAKLIHDGETIILDSGSTTVEIARCIRQRSWQALTRWNSPVCLVYA